MSEEAIFSGGNFTVTPSMFQVAGKTYAVSEITSAKLLTIRPVKGPSVLVFLGVIGLYFAFSGQGYLNVPTLMLWGGICWAYWGKRHVVALTTASGEVQALASRDAKLIRSVVDAINEAIIRRG